MTFYEKFIFPELDKKQVVNSHNSSRKQEDLFAKVVDNLIDNADLLKPDNIIPTEEANDLENIKNAGSTNSPNEVPNFKTLEEVEAIKTAAYNEGYRIAEDLMNVKLTDLQNKLALHSQIFLELEKLYNSKVVYEQEVVKAAVSCTRTILGKLLKIYPSNLSEILESALGELLGKIEKISDINIKINPNNYDHIVKLIETTALPEYLKKKIKVEGDKKLSLTDFIISHNSTSIEYNEELILAAIDKILNK